MGNTSLFIVLQLCLISIVTSQNCETQPNCIGSANHVNATWRVYNPERNGWDLHKAGAYCSPWIGSKPLAWRKQYGWTAFCGPSGPRDQASCGRCLKVINTLNKKSVFVRIVDRCSSGALEMEEGIFRKLDLGGTGLFQGYLVVDYMFENC